MQITADTIHNKQHSISKWYRMAYTMILILTISTLILISACSQSPRKARNTKKLPSSVNLPSKLSERDKVIYINALKQLEQGNYKTAHKSLTKISKTYSGMSGAQANLALVYFYLNDLNKSLQYTEQALALNPKLAEGHFLKGLLYTRSHDYLEAEKQYKKAIELSRDYSNAHYNLALLYDNFFQKPEKAIPHYQTYLELTNAEDQRTIDWVSHLKNSLNSR